MGEFRKISGPAVNGGNDFARMTSWPRELLAIQTAVSAAGDDLDRVLRIVLHSSIRLIRGAEGGEVELLEGNELVCRATFGFSPRKRSSRTHSSGILPGFCSISEQGRRGTCSSINAPIPFEGSHVGLLRLHSRVATGFSNSDLLALQLLAGLITQGLARDAHAKGKRARAEADKRFKATFDQAAVGIAHVTPDGAFIMVNDKFCEIAGHERNELIEGGYERITHPEDLGADLANVQDLLDGRTHSYSMEKRYLRKDGSTAWVNLTVSLVRKPGGAPDFFVSVIADISAPRAAELDAQRHPRTGLLNPHGVSERLEQYLACDGAWLHGIAAAFFDLDCFTRVSDGFGRSEGVRCLTTIASALRKALPADDVIARLGGDEFLALFPASADEVVSDVLERLQREVAAISDSEDWTVSASFGVALVPAGSTPDPAAVIAAADKLMYKAKQSKGDGPLVGIVPIAA